MIILEPYAKIMHVEDRNQGIKLLQQCEYAARISHRTEEKQTDESWFRFLKAVVMDKGDWSVVEHVSIQVDVLTDRGITHEIVRHRLASYTQESTRFCNYGKGDGQIKIISPFGRVDMEIQHPAYMTWYKGVLVAERAYLDMLEEGASPQIARGVLPNSLASRILWTMNLRAWRHVLIMRTTREAHPQMRQIMIPLLQEFQEKIPLLYDDIVPNQQQKDAAAVLK